MPRFNYLLLLLCLLGLSGCGGLQVTDTTRNMFSWQEEPYGPTYRNDNANTALGIHNRYLGQDAEHMYFLSMQQSADKGHVYHPVLVKTRRNLAKLKEIDLRPYSGRMHLDGLAYWDNRHVSTGGKVVGSLLAGLMGGGGSGGGSVSNLAIDFKSLKDTLFVDALYAYGWVHVFYRHYDKKSDKNRLFARTIDTETMQVGDPKLIDVYEGINRVRKTNTYRIYQTRDSSRIVISTGLRSGKVKEDEKSPIRTLIYTSNLGFKIAEFESDGFQVRSRRKGAELINDGATPVISSSGNYIAYKYLDVAPRRERKNADNMTLMVYDFQAEKATRIEIPLPDEKNRDRNFAEVKSRKDARKRRKAKKKIARQERKLDKNEESGFLEIFSWVNIPNNDDKFEFLFYCIPARVSGLLGLSGKYTDRMYLAHMIVDPKTGENNINYYGFPTNMLDLDDINKDLIKKRKGLGFVQYLNLNDNVTRNPDGSLNVFGQVSFTQIVEKKNVQVDEYYICGDIHAIKIKGDELQYWEIIPKNTQTPYPMGRNYHQAANNNGGFDIFHVVDGAVQKKIKKGKKPKKFVLSGKAPTIHAPNIGIGYNTLNQDGVLSQTKVLGGLPEYAKFYPLLGSTVQLEDGRLLLPGMCRYKEKKGLMSNKKWRVNGPYFYNKLHKTYGFMKLPSTGGLPLTQNLDQ